MTLSPGTRLGPYEILAPIGAGGMGEVYRARDTKLDRDVAIKVLPESVAADPDTLARFEREAKAVAALSHPNILAIHDFGSHEGTAYAVMELLEGETLNAMLTAGPIPPRQAVDYALQVARGLSAAHEKGIVHRDLKPDNLFVTKDRHVKILDFGLARRVDVISSDGETTNPTVTSHTQPGTVIGTMGYMSPEQVRGFPVDHRSDIFSFGAILYELLTGAKAFKKDTGSDTMAAILRDEPPEPADAGIEISPGLDSIVRHCLEKDRDHRFQSVKEIVYALSEGSSLTFPSGVRFVEPPAGKHKAGKRKATRRKALPIIAAAVLVLAVAAVVLWRRSPSPPSSDEVAAVRRVAVLPFENIGPAEDDYFADGIADEVRSKLTSLPGVEVIARGSSTPYKKTTKTPSQIAQELGVGYILTATVRREKGGESGRVYVTPELVEVRKAGAPTVKWQHGFDAALTDVFAVQSVIASRVAEALGVALGAGEEKRLSEKPTQDLGAYNAYLKGEEIWNGTGDDAPSVRRALAFYDQAVALDPGFLQAWARVSWSSSILYANSTPTPELAERARSAAEKAIALAPNRPEGYLAFGHYERLITKDFDRALEQYAKGQRVAPGNADLLYGTARAQEGLGRWDAAVERLRKAASFDPRSVVNLTALGYALQRLRRYPEAREFYERGLALAPANLSLIGETAMTYLGEGNLAGARAVLHDVPKDVGSTDLVAYIANANDLVWVLDEQQRELLLRLTPSAFDDDRGTWARCLSQAAALEHDATGVRSYADEARHVFEEQLRAAPANAQRHVVLGLALAYLGRKEEAIREGERAVALDPVEKDALRGPYYQHELVRIYMLVGEPEKALDRLEPLLKIPYYLSPGWLSIDPNFDPLRKNPRFQKLVAGG